MAVEIALEQLGKRFRFEWIFRNLTARLQPGDRWAVLGPNGSGKSTLLKILSGHLSPTKGRIHFFQHGQKTDPGAVYRQVAYAAPYIELIEEFTLDEILLFQARLKPFMPGLNPQSIPELIELPGARHKSLKYFSSGMKQRVRLALAICSDTPVLLLDEPSTNLDKAAAAWFHALLDRYAEGRLVVIATNEQADVEACRQFLDIRTYKT
ncbi:MAG: ABC transporter ATP-binding protein [Saprospiraceae bacterium]|nr:ABC transporter ATP-binding protein [Saprospiraceae bacterium]